MEENKRWNTENRFEYFAEEIIANILARLPIEQILRYKCVCKTWYALITNDHFAKLQLTFTNQQSSYRVILEQSEKSSPDNKLFLLDIENDGKCRELPTYPLPILIQDRHPDQYLIMSFLNGLICVASRFRVNPILIYNPLVSGDYIRLPTITMTTGRHEVTLGFDSSINKYKAINMSSPFDQLNIASLCEVFTIGKDSSWRKLDIPSCRVLTHRLYRGGVFHQGYIYWTLGKLKDVRKSTTKKDCILEFDVTNEVFKVISFPRKMKAPRYKVYSADDRNLHVQLHVLGECVALMEYDGSSLHIWRIVKQDGKLNVRYSKITIEFPYNYANLHSLFCLNGDEEDSMFLHINGCFGPGRRNKELAKKIQFYSFCPRKSEENDHGLVNLMPNLQNVPSSYFFSRCFKPSLLSIQAAST